MKNKSSLFRKIVTTTLLLGGFVVLLLTFPTIWGPFLAKKIAQNYLPEGSTLQIERIGLCETTIKSSQITPISFDEAHITYSIISLIRGHIKTAQISNISLSSPPDLSAVTNILNIGNTSLNLNITYRSQSYTGSLSGELFGASTTASIRYIPSNSLSFGSQIRIEPKFKNATDLPLILAIEKAQDNDFATINLTIGKSAINPSGKLTFGDDSLKLELSQDDAKLTQADPLLHTIQELMPPNINYMLPISYDFSLTKNDFETAYAFHLNLNDGTLELQSEEQQTTINGINTALNLNGSGTIYQLSPVTIRFQALNVGDFLFENGKIKTIILDKHIFVNKAEVTFSGGQIYLYAIDLNTARERLESTIYIDNIELNQFLSIFPEIKATANGTLFGRIPITLDSDGKITIRDSYIYAPPGTISSLKIANPDIIAEFFQSHGIGQNEASSLKNILKELNYTTFRTEIIHSQERRNISTLSIIIKGETTASQKPTPINISLNINGEIEKLLSFILNHAKMDNRK